MRGLPIEEPLPQRRGGRRLVLICITIACIGTVICVSCTRPLSNAWSRQPQDYDPSSPFPRKIWQTLDDVNASPNDYLANLSDSWKLMNPEYRYELLTVKSALTFIEEDLEIEPDLVDAVEEKQGHTIFPELVRALIMLAHGGVYAHADSQCSQPIDAWIPCELTDQASLVVGIELDPQEGRKQYGALFPVQLSNWTFMAKPGSPPLRYIMETMLRFAEEDPTCDKLSSTRSHAGGTNLFTEAIMEYLDLQIDHTVSYADISNLTKPKLIEDVLILPISAFGSWRRAPGSRHRHWGQRLAGMRPG